MKLRVSSWASFSENIKLDDTLDIEYLQFGGQLREQSGV